MAGGWVCPECALDYDALPLDALAPTARHLTSEWGRLISGSPAEALRKRPAPETWSPLEYAAHTRDVTGELTAIVSAMAAGQTPPGMVDPDVAVIERAWNDEDPHGTLDGLVTVAGAYADRVSTLTPEEAAQEADFPYGRRDTLTMARNAVHEMTHHLMDARRGLAAV
jgi:DinB superfamily